MAKQFVQTRPFTILGLIVAAWFFIPPIGKAWLDYSFFEMQAPAISSASYLRDVQDYWVMRNHSKQELIEAIRDLARLNAAYEAHLRENEMLRNEIERLEAIIGLPRLPDHRYEIARVARRDINGWWQQIIIRKGRNAGIEEGQPVIFTGGVVGRVSKVYSTTATVELLSSQHLRLAAMLEGDDRPISYRGGINRSLATPRGIAELVSPDIDTSPDTPLRLITSGLGGVFPAGLQIGEVQSLTIGPDGLFQSGEVLLDERLKTLHEVAVLIPLNNGRR